ncbi:MAG: hypothetical protein AB1444_14475 [Spirochaetota bacterium]
MIELLKYYTTGKYGYISTYPDGGVVIAGYGVREGKLLECITDQNGNNTNKQKKTEQ